MVHILFGSLTTFVNSIKFNFQVYFGPSIKQLNAFEQNCVHRLYLETAPGLLFVSKKTREVTPTPIYILMLNQNMSNTKLDVQPVLEVRSS